MSEEPPRPAAPGDGPPPSERRREGRTVRWQALFASGRDAFFALDRRRRLLFVNRAWEALAGLPAAEVVGLLCRRPRPAGPEDSLETVLAHALTPPAEVLQGQSARVRRLLPARPGAGAAPPTPSRWWDVEFFPVRREGAVPRVLILGRVHPVSPAHALALRGTADEPAAPPPLSEGLAALRERAARRHDFALLASPVPAVRKLAEQVKLASRVDTPVWLLGEAGTGKQALARAIHYQGPRRELAFAALDCARLPAAAVARVLFGDRAGAQRAALATVYLREPAQLPRDLQLRLCEWLAADRRDPAVDGPEVPRVLAGSRANPDDEVRAGRLHEDLACALGALVFEVPPLRERVADLPLLVERLLERQAALVEEGEEERRVTALTPAAWELVRAYPWPGNLRELDAALGAAARACRGATIDAGDLPAGLRAAQQPAAPERVLSLPQLLEQVERRLIELALRRAGGHQGRAARLLSVWPSKLSRRLKELKIAPAEAPEEGPQG
jgi:transcriptional regulator with AAA-type ATPase domain